MKRGTVEQLDSDLRSYHRYFWEVGQRVYEEHRQNSRPSLKMAKVFPFVQYAVEQLLNHKLSPDAICGRARLEGRFPDMVCTKTLYNYIDQGLLSVRNIDLPLKVRRKVKSKRNRKAKRRYGRSIHERPDIIQTRQEFGHWEIDTVIGNQETSSVLLTLDERQTRRRHIVKIPSRTTAAVREGMEKIAAQYGSSFSSVFKTITSDNGSEFATLPEIVAGTTVYYADPYSSYQRGTNEKQNSLIRRFLPKGRSFDNVPDSFIAWMEDWINNLPRKLLNYHSSAELFHSVLFDIAI